MGGGKDFLPRHLGAQSTGRFASNNPFRQDQASSSHNEQPPPYQPPAGPPPSWSDDKKKHPQDDAYLPPPGPPPSHAGNDVEPPPYDPWLAVPDNSSLPPPPALKEEFSPANNASYSDAQQAHAWCRAYPIWRPRNWDPEALSRIANNQNYLVPPPGNNYVSVSGLDHGRTRLYSPPGQPDTTILSALPLYTALHGQLQPGQQKTIYVEITLKYLSGPNAAVALGFLAPPYPPHRLPGWHRGSLGVHSDDGRRYVNDDCGGRDFVQPFRVGERIGLGMRITASTYTGQPNKVWIFFTRNGREENGWDLHEPRDSEAQDGGVVGLDGEADLYAAIGVCAGVDLEVTFGANGTPSY